MTIRNALRTLNDRTLRYPQSIERYANDARTLEKALVLVPCLYFYLLFQAFVNFAQWSTRAPLNPEKFQPLLPIAWLSGVSFENVALIIYGTVLVGMIIASVFFAKRWARIVAFLVFWQFHTFLNSFGQWEHNTLVWLYPLFFLIFLPDVWNKMNPTTMERKSFLIGFVGVQMYLGLVYSLAGLGKIYRGVFQLIAGQANFLSPDAFALHIANWLPTIGSNSLLGPFFIAHPYAGWPLFLIHLYFQLFTLWAIFRPSLHRIWGIVLICFHITTYLTMNILFIDSIFLLAVLLINSPFERPDTTWRERLSELPIFGWVLQRGARAYAARSNT